MNTTNVWHDKMMQICLTKQAIDDEAIASTSESVNDESEHVEHLAKIEPSYHLNDNELIDLFDESDIQNRNGESHEHRTSTPFDDNAFNDFGEMSAVGDDEAIENADAIENANAIENAFDSSPLPVENTINSVEEKEKVRFLNLTNEVLEISGDDLDALREELAYGSDNEDSFAELVKEFDNLVENGIKLPAPIKEELNDANGQSAEVPNLNENPVNDVTNDLDPENIGEPSTNDRIRAEYTKCQVENSTDPVLGNMARLFNVSDRIVSCLNKFSIKMVSLQELKNRWVLKYNIEVKSITYELLEFYNSLSGVIPKFYDEKFARIMFTSFIGSEKVAKAFEYDPKNNVVLFMKGMSFSYEY